MRHEDRYYLSIKLSSNAIRVAVVTFNYRQLYGCIAHWSVTMS